MNIYSRIILGAVLCLILSAGYARAPNLTYRWEFWRKSTNVHVEWAYRERWYGCNIREDC